MINEQTTSTTSPAADNLVANVTVTEVPHEPDQPSRLQELPGQVVEAIRHLLKTEEAWVVAVMLGGVLTGQRELAAVLSVLPVGIAAQFRLEDTTGPNAGLTPAEAGQEMWQQSRGHVMRSVLFGAVAAYSQTLAAGAGQLAQEAAQAGWDQVAQNQEPIAKGILYLVGGMAGMRVVEPFHRLRQAGGAIKEAGQNLNEKRQQVGMQWGRVREFFSGTVFAATNQAEGPRNKFAGLMRDFSYWMDQLATKIEQRNETSSN